MDEDIIEEEELEESKFKKFIVPVIGVFLVLLLISYIIIGYPISNIIRGQLESSPIEGNEIKLDEFSIVFDENVKEELEEIYFSEQKVEFSVCLQGNKYTDYFITSLYQPKMFSQTFNHVSFESCKDSLILLHSHPYKSCLASEVDISTLNKMRVDNPDALMVVMCEPGRFSVY